MWRGVGKRDTVGNLLRSGNFFAIVHDEYPSYGKKEDGKMRGTGEKKGKGGRKKK